MEFETDTFSMVFGVALYGEPFVITMPQEYIQLVDWPGLMRYNRFTGIPALPPGVYRATVEFRLRQVPRPTEADLEFRVLQTEPRSGPEQGTEGQVQKPDMTP